MRTVSLRTRLALAAIPLGILLPVGAASAPSARGLTTVAAELTISAEDSPISFGSSTTIRGRLKSSPVQSNVPVLLQQKPSPYTGDFETVDTTTTNGKGAYSFRISPDVSSRYRTTTAAPQAFSKEVQVEVRVKVVLRLSDRTPRAGERVKFRGTVGPEHDGHLVYVQRRVRGGKWRTAKKVALQDAGDELSRFATRIRVRRDGTYRAKVFHDADHADGTSRPKRADVR